MAVLSHNFVARRGPGGGCSAMGSRVESAVSEAMAAPRSAPRSATACTPAVQRIATAALQDFKESLTRLLPKLRGCQFAVQMFPQGL